MNTSVVTASTCVKNTYGRRRRLLPSFVPSLLLPANAPLDPSDSNLLRRNHSRQAYLDFLTALRERNSVSKFDLDITMGEQFSKHFFRAPAAAHLRLNITSVDTPSG